MTSAIVSVHPQARQLAVSFAGQLAEAAPGLLVGLHLVGSAVLDDYLPGRSDLDVVGELARGPDEADLAALAAVHGDNAAVEGTYVLAGELDGPVAGASSGPSAQEGKLVTGERSFQLNPVTWQQLRDLAETVLGRPPRPVVDATEVAAFCQGNLVEYWVPLLDHAETVISTRSGEEPAPADTVVWIALGPPRLWHTVRTGRIVSKTAAGRLAADAWPDLAAPLAEILAARHDPDAVLTTRHARAAIAIARRAATAAAAAAS